MTRALALVALLLLSGCADSSDREAPTPPTSSATIDASPLPQFDDAIAAPEALTLDTCGRTAGPQRVEGVVTGVVERADYLVTVTWGRRRRRTGRHRLGGRTRPRRQGPRRHHDHRRRGRGCEALHRQCPPRHPPLTCRVCSAIVARPVASARRSGHLALRVAQSLEAPTPPTGGINAPPCRA